MNSDLISRRDAIEALHKLCLTEGLIDEFDTEDTLRKLPSAEPERKKGEWKVQPSTGDDRPFIWWKCSECGHVIYSETEEDRMVYHAYCGRCGAKMK